MRAPEAGAVSKQVTAPPNAADRFDELRAIWQRPWNDEGDLMHARSFFEKACRSTDPDVIIAGAVRWVKAADDPRYLQRLSKWLAARSWEKPPPKKQQRKAEGRRGKVDLSKVLLKDGADWLENEDGSLFDPATGRTLQ